MRFILAAMVGAATVAVAAWVLTPSPFAACLGLFPGGSVPQAKSDTVVDLCKSADGQPLFAVRFDTSRKIPNWTAHSLSPAQVARINANSGKMTRPGFKPGPDVPPHLQARDSSYTNNINEYQRGHMVSAGDMRWSEAAYTTTFIFTNAAPQLAKLNNGTWRGLEDSFRDMVEAKDVTMWAIAGSYGSVGKIGTTPFTPTVPKCFYKIIVAKADDGQSYKVLATLFEWSDRRRRAAWRESLTTLEQIEQRSGIDFRKGLTVEADFDAAYWGVAMPARPADCT